MGASFKAIHKQVLAYRDTGYGTIHTIRIAMLACAEKICHREEDTWSTWYRDVLYNKRHDNLEDMFTEIKLIANNLWEKGQTDDWSVLTGIVDFCNHSDCDGGFYECEFIVDAIRKTILTVETPDRIRETMEDLCAVFEKAAEDDDYVEIYRGGIEMKTHNLKIATRWANDIIDQHKRFEVRRDDRDYSMGDRLILQEYEDGKYTGFEIRATITYMLRHEDFPEGIMPGYCILGITVHDCAIRGGSQ